METRAKLGRKNSENGESRAGGYEIFTQTEALVFSKALVTQSKKMIKREDHFWDGVRETCATVYGMTKRSKQSLWYKWRTILEECQAWLSCRESVRKRRITGDIDSDAMEEYTQALYASCRTGKKITKRFRYHNAADYLSKYRKFAGTDEIDIDRRLCFQADKYRYGITQYTMPNKSHKRMK